MTTFADPTLWTIFPDPNFDIVIREEMVTDVQRAILHESRANMFIVPIRTIEFTASVDTRLYARWRSLWMNAPERLRYYVPLYPDRTDVTATALNSVTCDTTNRDFVPGQKAAIFKYDGTGQVLTINAVFSDHFTTVENVEILDALIAYPAIAAWLTPPTKELRAAELDQIALSFEEEVPGLAGVDPSVGDGFDATADYDHIFMDFIRDTLPNPKETATIRAYVYSKDGEPVQNPVISWVVIQTGLLPLTDPSIRYGVSENGRVFNMEWEGDADSTFQVTATAGSISAAVSLSPA